MFRRMIGRRPSPAMTVALIGLFVALGGTTYAATGNLVNIADGSNASHLAKVDAAGKLEVGDGRGSLTVDGRVGDARAATTFRSLGFASNSCAAVATAPADKALVVTDVNVDVYVSTTSFANLYIGPTPCGGALLTAVDFTSRGLQPLQFQTGVVVPAGQVLSIYSDTTLTALATGYTAAPSTVPSSGSSLGSVSTAAAEATRPSRP